MLIKLSRTKNDTVLGSVNRPSSFEKILERSILLGHRHKKKQINALSFYTSPSMASGTFLSDKSDFLGYLLGKNAAAKLSKEQKVVKQRKSGVSFFRKSTAKATQELGPASNQTADYSGAIIKKSLKSYT